MPPRKAAADALVSYFKDDASPKMLIEIERLLRADDGVLRFYRCPDTVGME